METSRFDRPAEQLESFLTKTDDHKIYMILFDDSKNLYYSFSFKLTKILSNDTIQFARLSNFNLFDELYNSNHINVQSQLHNKAELKKHFNSIYVNDLKSNLIAIMSNYAEIINTRITLECNNVMKFTPVSINYSVVILQLPMYSIEQSEVLINLLNTDNFFLYDLSVLLRFENFLYYIRSSFKRAECKYECNTTPHKLSVNYKCFAGCKLRSHRDSFYIGREILEYFILQKTQIVLELTTVTNHIDFYKFCLRWLDNFSKLDTTIRSFRLSTSKYMKTQYAAILLKIDN